MSSLLSRAYERIVAVLPPDVAGRLDSFRPNVRNAWGGPLNGQEQRRAIVRALARKIDVNVVVETGTYRGTTTEFFSAVFGVPVETVEAHPRFAAYSRRRLAVDPRVTLTEGDSRDFLREVAQRWAGRTAFIYLDAHWELDLPLREELELIQANWPAVVVMIDDFCVPDDPGYGYDDYGTGKALVADYLPELPGWRLLYPTAPSAEETGRQRGCCVLLSPALAGVEVAELRRVEA